MARKPAKMQGRRNMRLIKRGNTPRQARPRRRNAGRVQQMDDPLVSAVCSQLDPFCEHATGAKVYDRNEANTFTFTSRQLTAFAAPGDTYTMVEFSPNPLYAYRFNECDNATGLVTATGTWKQIPEAASIDAEGFELRVVTSGIKITNTTSAFTAAGSIRVVESPTEATVTTGYGQPSPTAEGFAFTAGQEIYVINRSSQPDKKTDFQRATQMGDTGTNSTSSYIQVWMVGVPLDASLLFEHVTHYEVLVSSVVGFVATMTTTPSPSVPVIMDSATTAGTKAKLALQTTATGIGKYLKSIALYAIKKVAIRGASALASRYLGPAGGAGVQAIGDMDYSNIMEVD